MERITVPMKKTASTGIASNRHGNPGLNSICSTTLTVTAGIVAVPVAQ